MVETQATIPYPTNGSWSLSLPPGPGLELPGGSVSEAHKFRRLIKTDKLESHRELRVIKFNRSGKPFDYPHLSIFPEG